MTPADIDEVVAASNLFDAPARHEWVRTMLEQAGHHLAIAYDDATPAGFVSGVEMTHPDKGTEMFLYELGVDDAFQRRGIGRALTEALAARGRARGCGGMWVLTERENEAAVATYRAAGADEESDHVMLGWSSL